MTALAAIFCADPLDPRMVEPDFAVEREAAREAGFAAILINHDELDQRIDPVAALKKSRVAEPARAVYRGWMLRSEAYAALYDALRARHVELLTKPGEYAACHHAPESYPALAPWMAKTVSVPAARIDDPAALRAALAEFGTSPVILKDWVKSQASGYWKEACFIANAADEGAAARVIARFRELQGESLTGGLVFKAWLPLEPGEGAAFEYRAFCVGGRCIGCWPRSEAAARLPPPPGELLTDVAARIPSPFASADFARDRDGGWWLLEVGDGQVSGLPNAEAAGVLFAALGELMALA